MLVMGARGQTGYVLGRSGGAAGNGLLVQQVSLHNAIGIPFSNDQTLFKLRTNYCAPGLALPN